MIVCTDRNGSCRKNICECDKRLVERLTQLSGSESNVSHPITIIIDKWDESNHQGIGNFDREEKCKRGRGHKILEFNTATSTGGK